MPDRIYIFDTTLRDGEQSPGATMNTFEKIRMAHQLEALGVDIIEAGFPAASQGDFEAVQAIAKAIENAQVAGLCRAMPADIDRAWDAVKGAKNPRIHTFIATSDIHIKHKFGKTREQILEMAEAAVKRAASHTPNVEFSAEDASRSDWDYLARVVETAIAAGATTVNIPDTVGYAQPVEFAELIRFLLEKVPNSHKAVFSVHCHNDLGLGVANTLAALKAGARQAEVTVSGIGERAGNAALEEVIMSLNTRRDYFQLETGIKADLLFPTCRMLSTTIGQPIPPYKPITGANAFAHESGIHQDGMIKNRLTYEIMTPESVGRKGSELIIGKHSGRNAIKTKLAELGFSDLAEDQVGVVFEAVKALADRKERIFDEDVEALVHEKVYHKPDRFELVDLIVTTGTGTLKPTAAVCLKVDNETVQCNAFGAGPVDAVFNAVSQAVGIEPKLERFQVNAITGGTDAQGAVTVRIELDGKKAVGRGSDEDIIRASAKAYVRSLNRLAKMTQENGECSTL
jgi:2-isopropylmalate synthase